jgi:hypothetical protein
MSTRMVIMVERARMERRSLIKEAFSVTIARNMAILLMNVDQRVTQMMLKQRWPEMMMMKAQYC